ncbi:hypothetical protein FISHEDRAFT_43578 [Fistulina hepatica ATCC 64428]|uniref:Centrosomin N-terminal motif 1 domain-containing protein n=1 Tax=Fistulina hepatica ATCC 64428 TaxID=1128425 RepID=A0A0D7ACT1_9AGAR|nr:hypothetical protein FISHEDRAFT_43578 [Fistulina hepatica ATCC 64428]
MTAESADTVRNTKRRKGGALTLRDQEKHIDSLKKENFDVKLRVHFLEERLAKLAPDHIEAALKQNISLKIELYNRGLELKKMKKLTMEMQRELDRLQKGQGGARSRERELEDKLEEREREVRELRRKLREGRGDEDAIREIEQRNEDLEQELTNTQGLLQDNIEEIERMQELLENQGDSRKILELKQTNEDLLERWEQQREADSYARSESRAQVLEERDHREHIEDELNTMRDKLAAAMIELQQREDDVDAKEKEIEDIMVDHRKFVEQVEDEWRGEVEEARGQVEELRDVLAERETEARELRLNITELEGNTNDLHAKFEAALAHLEKEAADKDAEVESLNNAVDKLSEQVYVLEDDNDRIKEENERIREDEAAERERLEAVCAALKEVQELAHHVEELVAELERERTAHQGLEDEFNQAQRDHDSALRDERRALEAKETALQKALSDLARTQSLLTQRNEDLQAVQRSLQTLETESKKAGETHTTARFSLQLEVDRLKRDLERVEADLARARKELADKDAQEFDRGSSLEKLHDENRDLKMQLASQTQARLNVSGRLDEVQATLKMREDELAALRPRLSELELRLSKDQRAMLSAEAQYRDQLTERNTLLLTIYQYMDKILGVDKTPKKGGQAETKPFTNFGVFHDNLLTRLKSLSHIQSEFEKRCKTIEAGYTEKLADIRKQLDNRWKQIDKFETSVKSYAEAKTNWRRKLASREGELDAVKATNSEMAAQLAVLKRPGQSDGSEVRALTARATNAERRLNNAQNQLAATEEKIASMNQRSSAADNKWEMRVKEYESRLKAAEERIKRERQGGKERALELENAVKSLQRQLEIAQKRSQQLNDVVATQGKKSPSSNSAGSR